MPLKWKPWGTLGPPSAQNRVTGIRGGSSELCAVRFENLQWWRYLISLGNLCHTGKRSGVFSFHSYIQFESLLFPYLSFFSSAHTVHCCEELGSVFSDSSHRGRLLFLCPPKPLHVWAEEAPSSIRTNKVWADLLPVTLLLPGRLWLVCRSLLSTTLRFSSAVLLFGWTAPGWHWSQGLFNPRCNTFHMWFLNFTRLLSPHSSSLQLSASSLWLYWLVLLVWCHLYTLCVLHHFYQVTDRGVNQVRSQPPAVLQLLLACRWSRTHELLSSGTNHPTCFHLLIQTATSELEYKSSLGQCWKPSEGWDKWHVLLCLHSQIQ